ncbi:MAG: DUF5655 domain-containing protein [Acidimicrobiales bacterium]
MTLDDYFSAVPDQASRSGTGPVRERPIFDAVFAHLDALGDIHVEPVSVGIFFKRSRGFAELRPKSKWVELSFGLPRTIEHPKITRIIRASAARTYHFVRLREPSDVDSDVRDWLTEAYFAVES